MEIFKGNDDQLYFSFESDDEKAFFDEYMMKVISELTEEEKQEMESSPLDMSTVQVNYDMIDEFNRMYKARKK